MSSGSGYVYKIFYGELCYYGSSRDAVKRIKKHKDDYNYYKKHGGNKCTSVIVFELAKQKGELPSSEIFETFDEISDEDLAKREDYYIVNYECVNENRAFMTDEEKKEDNKLRRRKYRENNKEREKIKEREYREANKEKANERNRKYREANKEKIKKTQRKYREKKISHQNPREIK